MFAPADREAEERELYVEMLSDKLRDDVSDELFDKVFDELLDSLADELIVNVVDELSIEMFDELISDLLLASVVSGSSSRGLVSFKQTEIFVLPRLFIF
jgi:hypothetical protein